MPPRAAARRLRRTAMWAAALAALALVAATLASRWIDAAVLLRGGTVVGVSSGLIGVEHPPSLAGAEGNVSSLRWQVPFAGMPPSAVCTTRVVNGQRTPATVRCFLNIHEPALIAWPYGVSYRAAGASATPLWPPALALALVAAGLWPGARRHGPGRCEACGYDVSGAARAACPECGRRVAPAAEA
jgi:hypothetical protein